MIENAAPTAAHSGTGDPSEPGASAVGAPAHDASSGTPVAAGPGRRDFLRGGVAAVAGALAGGGAPFLSASSYARVLGANDRIRTGFVGVGNRGGSLLDLVLEHCKDVEPAAICDVYRPYLDFALSKLPAGAPGHVDHRALLEDASLDAVVIGTPDHWHAIQFLDACRAGKDVYVEKPLSLTVSEGRRMVQVAAETGRVAQMGAQRHSSPYVIEACELLRGGAIGKITRVRCFHTTNEFPNGIGRRAATPPPIPEGLDWDRWLGPAPAIPFEPLVWNYKFRWFWEYSGGQLTNFGTHWLDVIHMGIGRDTPDQVVALGGVFAVEDDRQIPDTAEVLWRYGDCLVSFSQINSNDAPGSLPGVEIEFRGTLGTLYLKSSGWEIVPEGIQDGEYPARGPLNRDAKLPTRRAIEPRSGKGGVDQVAHLKNFFDAMRSRGKCSCDPETAHRSTATTLLGRIALQVGERLDWDGAAERFTNSEKANALLSYEYRKPWSLEA